MAKSGSNPRPGPDRGLVDEIDHLNAIMKIARNAAIEECALVVDNWTKWENLADITAAIRALKDDKS